MSIQKYPNLIILISSIITLKDICNKIKSDGLIDFDLKTSNGNIYPKKSISDTGLENISTVEFEVHAYK